MTNDPTFQKKALLKTPPPGVAADLDTPAGTPGYFRSASGLSAHAAAERDSGVPEAEREMAIASLHNTP